MRRTLALLVDVDIRELVSSFGFGVWGLGLRILSRGLSAPDTASKDPTKTSKLENHHDSHSIILTCRATSHDCTSSSIITFQDSLGSFLGSS